MKLDFQEKGGMIDRRRNCRLPVRLPVAIGGLPVPVFATMVDLSVGGLALVSEQPLPVRDGLNLILKLTIEEQNRHLCFQGRVVREEACQGAGHAYAVAFEAPAAVECGLVDMFIDAALRRDGVSTARMEAC